MDLVPRHNDCEGFHVNWFGWHYLGDLLDQLGCDTSRMSGCNDGDYVPARMAREWGKAIVEAVDKNLIRDICIAGPIHSSGLRQLALVLEDTNQDLTDMIAKLSFDNPDYRKIEELDEDTKEWLRQFANFCINSGGFRQY